MSIEAIIQDVTTAKAHLDEASTMHEQQVAPKLAEAQELNISSIVETIQAARDAAIALSGLVHELRTPTHSVERNINRAGRLLAVTAEGTNNQDLLAALGKTWVGAAGAHTLSETATDLEAPADLFVNYLTRALEYGERIKSVLTNSETDKAIEITAVVPVRAAESCSNFLQGHTQ